MDLLVQFLDFLWSSFLLLAPMLLLGLFLAGLIHVFISRQAILKWLRRDSLKSVASSAAIGVPMPLCSCSVVPVVAEMRRKGASRSSCMSFLITAPETGADSILVTHAFFGPIAAVVRPVISFVTGVVAGIFCIGLIRDRDAAETGTADEDHDPHDHDHGHAHHHHTTTAMTTIMATTTTTTITATSRSYRGPTTATSARASSGASSSPGCAV